MNTGGVLLMVTRNRACFGVRVDVNRANLAEIHLEYQEYPVDIV